MKAIRKDEAGLTLIEIMVSMMVFLVVSAGVATSLTSGLRTTMQTRLATMGKAQAQQQIEEMRSRVFYVPNSTNVRTGSTAPVDLLDRYYPGVSKTHTTDSLGWQGWYATSGGDAYFTKVSPADAKGVVRTVTTRFVDNTGNTVVPASSYDTNREGFDTPPSSLVSVNITTTWADQTGENRYELDSIISAIGQAVQGSGESEGEQGCSSNSNNNADAISGIFKISTGEEEPYTSFIEGNFGEAHASLETGCEMNVTGRGTGGKMAVVNGSTYMGADVSVTGPPEIEQHDGPKTVGPNAGWPTATFTNSKTEGEAETESDELEGEGEASVGAMTVAIQQVDGWPGGTVSDYQLWDFLNPVVQVTGGTNGQEEDADHADDQAEAEIIQKNGTTKAEGELFYQQINILPMQAKTDSTPSALQGLVFIRNFRAEAHSQANGIPGGASSQVTYSATIGMFNTSKASSCSGDACYDLYTTVGPTNPLQTAISLSGNSDYRLQNALFTEWSSSDSSALVNATTVSNDGATATTSIDAIMKISARFGTEVRLKTDHPHMNEVTLVSPQGLEQVWLGAFEISVFQELV